MKLLLLSTTSSHCFFLLKVGVEGDLMPKKASLPKFLIKEQPFSLWLVAWPCPKHNLCMAWIYQWRIPRALAVAWVIDLNGWLCPTCRLLIFFLQGVVADCSLLWLVSQRNSTPATQTSWVLIWQQRMILPSIKLTTILFQWLLEIFSLQKFTH